MRLKLRYSKSLQRFVMLFLLSSIILSLFSGSLAYSIPPSTENSVKDPTLLNNIVWRPIARLTWLGNSTNPQIMRSDDGNYNIVWQDYRNGNWDIYYLKVRPDGFKLVNDSRITYFSGDDINPVLGVKGSHIYIVWQRKVNGHWAIYFARLLYSNKNILIEIHPHPVREINGDCVNPRIAVDSKGDIDIVWQEWNESNWEIMYDKLDPYGNPLFSPVDVSNTATPSIRPQIVVDKNDDVHVFWIEYTTTPGYSVFYRKLDSNGHFLTESRRISVVSPESTIDSYYYNDSLYTVFSCSRERLAYEVIFTRLSSSGYTEVDDTNLTVADRINSTDPQVAVIHNRMFVVWNDEPKGVIRFSIYDSYGNRIGEVVNLSSSNSFFPAISVNNQTIGIVWQKNLDNKTYLYFRSAIFPDVSVKSMKLSATTSNITLYADIYSSVYLNVEYGIYLDGKLVKNSTISFSGITFLRDTIPVTPGWHRVLLYLDPFNRIIESNETNNFMERSIYVKHFAFDVTLKNIYDLPAGRWSNISLFMQNTGNWIDSYKIQILYNSTLFKIKSPTKVISLNESEGKIINFEVYTYKTTIVGNYTFNLTVQSLTTGYKENKNITVRVLPYVDFKIEYLPMYTVLPGTKLVLKFIIENTGNCNDTYSIKLSQTQNWPLIYEKTLINTSYHASKYFNVTILIPNGTYGYTKNFVNLTMRSTTLNITMNVSVLLIVKPVHKVSAYVIYLTRNGTYYYNIKIKITNTGNMKDMFNLNITGTAAQYSYLSTSSLILKPRESAVVTINAYLPPYMPAGNYKVNFNVYYQNRSLAIIPILLTVEESHQFVINVEKLSEGEKVILRATVRNVGNTPELIEILPQLLKKINSTWILQYNGRNYTNITTVYVPQNRTVNVTIILHSKLPNGHYKVRIVFRSASHITRNITVEFRYGKKGILELISDFIMDNLVYIIIAAVVVVGVVVYLIKFRE